MKLSTIWTLPASTLWERLSRTREWALQKIAKRLPTDVKYWVFINSGVEHIRGSEVVPEVKYTEILQRMPYGRN